MSRRLCQLSYRPMCGVTGRIRSAIFVQGQEPRCQERITVSARIAAPPRETARPEAARERPGNVALCATTGGQQFFPGKGACTPLAPRGATRPPPR